MHTANGHVVLEEPLIELSNVTCGYQRTTVLRDVSLTIGAGELTGLVGPSGAGKTTLLRVILGQMRIQEGSVRVMGETVKGRPPKGIGYVPQMETINWSFPVTVEEVVLMGRAADSGPWPWPSREDRRAMSDILDRLGLLPLARRHIRNLSGGQQQRVFLARALMRSPRLLLLDEPTTGVDIKTRHDVLHLLNELNQSGITIVLTTHDLNAVATHLPHVVCLNHTIVAEGHPVDVFTPETLSATYGADMLVLRHGNLMVIADRLTAEGAPLGDSMTRLRSVVDLAILTEPFSYEFFLRGLIAATLVGALCGLLGVYIVLRGMSYIGHGLSHAVFGGAVVSYVLNLNFYIGAGLWGFASALLIHAVTRRRQIGADAAIGIITTASFAVGVAIISKTRRFTKNFEAALFGNILGVKPEDMVVLVGVTVLMMVAVFFLYKQLLFVTFDPEVAPTYGIPVDRIDALFSLMLSAGIIASMQVLGVTLIAAAIVIPTVIARLLTDRFSTLLWISTLLGAACGLVGIYSSYYLDVSSGATIVLVAATLFLITLVGSRLRTALGLRNEAHRVRGLVTSID